MNYTLRDQLVNCFCTYLAVPVSLPTGIVNMTSFVSDSSAFAS